MKTTTQKPTGNAVDRMELDVANPVPEPKRRLCLKTKFTSRHRLYSIYILNLFCKSYGWFWRWQTSAMEQLATAIRCTCLETKLVGVRLFLRKKEEVLPANVRTNDNKRYRKPVCANLRYFAAGKPAKPQHPHQPRPASVKPCSWQV
jgi:hypothetical protein